MVMTMDGGSVVNWSSVAGVYGFFSHSSTAHPPGLRGAGCGHRQGSASLVQAWF